MITEIRSALGRILPTPVRNVISRFLNKGAYSEVVARAHDREEDWTVAAAIDFIFAPENRQFRPWQNRAEFSSLAEEIHRQRPSVVLEIGTSNGGTLLLASLLADDDALIISLDLPGALFGGGYLEWKAPVYRAFARKGQVIHLIMGDSHSEAVFDQVKELLHGRKIDYLFIDGDHSYNGVRMDFEMYSQLVAEDGLVAFHDIVSEKRPVPTHFVSEYWKEVKLDYDYVEFVDDWDQNLLGLGLLRMGTRKSVDNSGSS